MPGDPIERLLVAHAGPAVVAGGADRLLHARRSASTCRVWKQYLNFWAALFHGDLGRSIASFPTPVSELIIGALPYTLALLDPGDPAQLLGREQGRRDGRAAQDARQHGAAGRATC